MIRGNERFLSQAYVFADFMVIQFAFLLAWWVQFHSRFATSEAHLPFQAYSFWSIVYSFIAIALGYFVMIYSPKRKKSFASELFKLIQIHSFSLLFLLSFLFIFKEMDVSRKFLFYFVTFSFVFVSLYRFIVKQILRELRKKGYNKQFILIIGAGTLGKQFYDNVLRHPELGFEVVGFLDDRVKEIKSESIEYKPILGKVEELDKVLEQHLIDEVVIALPLSAHEKFVKIVDACENAGVRVLIIPDFHRILPAKPSFDLFGDIPLINVRDVPLDELRNRVLKRAFDIVFSIFAIILTLPLMIIIAVIIKLTSPGPVIFKQERVGMNRRTFYMYKFRTMKHMPQSVSDTQWTTPDDPRKTKFGNFLRKTSLDELPQFFNVLKGDMSVVGPRPERPYFVNQFKEEIPKYMIKHHVRPGITGWAQVNGLRGDTSISERIKYDLFYIENWTFLFDIKIVLKTITNGFINKNAY